MIVECVKNRVSDFSNDRRISEFLRSTLGATRETLRLTIGKHYVIYADEATSEDLFYYLADDDCDDAMTYPYRYLSVFFNVIDSNLSSCWVESTRDLQLVRGFPEWVWEPMFYERLVDGEIREVDLFQRYRNLIEFEFPWPSSGCTADKLEDDWLLCPKCFDAWESVSRHGMVQCPKCATVMKNPRFERKVERKMPPTY